MKRSPLSRILSAVATLAVAAGLALTGASAAHAADDYSVSGLVHGPDLVALDGVRVEIEIPEPGGSPYVPYAYTDADGVFDFAGNIPAGGPYTVRFLLEGYGYTTTTVTVVDADVTVPSIVLLPLTDVTSATATVSGTGEVGTDLTVTTSGWPLGTVFSYQWFAPDGNSSGDIPGAEDATYTVTADVIGREVYVFVSGEVPAETASNMIASDNGVLAFDPERPTGAAPADLDAYLLANNSTPQPQSTAGLPSTPLNPADSYTAELDWTGADSFVDVYVFSTPVRVGTFAVVGGTARITLAPSVLGQLATGAHTLVATGQSSGTVQSLRLQVGLAATGAEPPVLPLGVAALLVLVGGALVIARRRVAKRG